MNVEVCQGDINATNGTPVPHGVQDAGGLLLDPDGGGLWAQCQGRGLNGQIIPAKHLEVLAAK